jgi:two-component system sensor histidine kinase GlrK
MKVSTRIVAGMGVLMVLAVLALVYQARVNRDLQTVTRELYTVNLAATKAADTMQRDSYLIAQDSQKFFGVDRAIYGKELEYYWSDFQENLSLLHKLKLSPAERDLVGDVQMYWKAYRDRWPIEEAAHPDMTKDFPNDLDYPLGLLDEKVLALGKTIDQAVANRVEAAKAMTDRARRISWISGSVALILGGFVCTLLLLTINKSLRQLTQGTRAISHGDFSHRIPDKGRDEFAELARDFNAMSQRLGELDQMKKDFVSHVSHELKAPLASIRQTDHLMLEQIPGTLNEQQRRLLRLSYNSAERLAAMVGNLLDLSRLEAGSMEYAMKPLDLLALVRNIVEEFEVQTNEKQITIRVEANDNRKFMVAADRERMTQVIGNLIDNALKFAPRGSEVSARLEERLSGADRVVVFSVADTGPGVADGHKEKIFQKFHQVKHGKKLTGQGVGLGLAICRSIVDAHQGKIWVQDNPAGGSIFCLELHAAAQVEVATTCG